jgi:hypothetical protein
LDALGIPGPDDVDDTVLSAQLEALTQGKAAAEDVTPVYQKLSRPASMDKWVWTKRGFQSLDHVSRDPAVQGLFPVFHFLREEWHDLPAFKGANAKLTPKELFQAMDMAMDVTVHMAAGAHADALHGVHMAAINLLAEHRGARGSLPDLGELARQAGSQLRAPTKAGKLASVHQTFFHDMTWHGEAPPADMEEVHADMSRAACERFGVRNLSEIVAQECSCGDGDWLEVTGQHEPLTRRLKNILKDYPWQALVKEMLQNAEDAGAAKFKVLIDRCPRGSESLLTPQMAGLQGPCIWFYNDAVFREKDFQALVNLGQGSKANEEGKIGLAPLAQVD